jgi:hypothetical protein
MRLGPSGVENSVAGEKRHSLLISGRPRQRRRVAGHGRWRHVADGGVAAAVRPFRGPRAVRPRLLLLPSMRKPLKKAFAEVRDLRPVSDDGCDSVSQRQPFAVEVLYERRQRAQSVAPVGPPKSPAGSGRSKRVVAPPAPSADPAFPAPSARLRQTRWKRTRSPQRDSDTALAASITPRTSSAPLA